MARGKKKNAPPGLDEASMGPGLPPPDGWGPDGPPPPGGWGPGGPGGPPRGWGPGGPPGGWGPGRPPGGWGPDGPPGGWGPDGPPGGWGPDGHPGGWGPGGPQGGWGPDGPPEFWGPRGPPPPEGWGPGGPPGGWAPRGPQGGWGPGPDGPMPPGGWGPGGPGGWGPGGPPPQHWGHGEWGPDRHPPGGWGNGGPGDWGPGGLPPHGGWGAGGPYGGPPQHPNYVGPPPIPPMGYGAMPVPPDPSYGQMPIVPPSVPPPGFVPPVAYTYPPPPVDSTGVAYPPTWPPEVTPYVAPPPEVMVNPAPEQPEWIKALISAPEKTDVTVEAKPIKTPESKPPTTATAQVPPVAKTQSNDCDDNVKKTKPLNLLGTRTFDKPPAGRSTGIISFIGPSFGYIEREDLEKFTFSFDAFFGNPKAMSPGIRVHFTACKEKNSKIATDVKVAPGGTENVDTEIYEGVVSQNIVQPAPGVKQKPGQIHIHMGPIQTNLTFEKRDCTVTLLRGDRVLINILTDIVTDKRRATNIKPKIPATFKYTKETREKGAIVSISDIEGIIQSEEHGELPFDLIENLGDTPFSPSEEVEFTIFKAKDKDRAIRISKLKAPPVKVEAEVQSRLEEAKKVEDENNEAMEEERTKEKENEGKEKAEGEEQEEEKKENEEEDKEKDKEEQKKEEPPAAKDKWMPTSFKELKLQEDEDISKQKFEGTVLKSIVKVPQKEKVGEEPEKEEDNQQGRLVMTLDGEQKQVSFTAADTLTTATMMDGDRIKFNIATHHLTKKERAIFVEILPDSFQESTEQRRTGIAIELEEETGIIRCQQNPQLFFRMSEVMEKRRLVLNEKVEFSVIPHETAEGGTQAIRIKRFVERVFLPVRKLGGIGASKAKKMTIKLTGDLTAKELDSTSKDVPGESNGKSSAESDKLKAVVKTLRAQDNKVSGVKKDYDSSRRRYGRSRSGSRSPVKDKYGRYKKARSTSRDRERIIRNRRSHSRERSRRRSRTRSRSRSRSREKSKERSKDRAIRKRNSDSKDREGSKRSRESSLPPGRVRHGDVVDDELARKKRELDDLNEMIARRKALVSMEPRGGMMDMRMEPEHRTCIDYNHGRIAVPIKEIQPVRSILKKRTESLGGPLFPIKTDSPDPDKYRYNPPTLDHIQPYDDPERLYYDRPYDDPYGDGSYDSRTYGDRYGDQYDSRYRDRAYSSSYDDRFYSDGRQGDRPYIERPFDERSYEQAPTNYPQQLRQSPEAQQPPPTQPSQAPVYVQSTHQFPHNESAPEQVGPRSPTPTQPYPRPTSPSQLPLSQSTSLENKPILTTQMSNFLNIFNKGVNPSLVPAAGTGPQNEIPALKEQIHEPVEPEFCEDGLLPHERAVQDGSGFSRILGLVQEEHSSSAASKTASVANVQQFLLRGETTPAAEDHYKSPSPVDQPRRDQDRISSQSPKRSSVEKNCEESKSQSGQFDKIQSLLRTIGIKLSTSGGKTEKSASTEKESDYLSRQVERHRSQSRTSSANSARAQSPSPARSSSKEAYGSRQGSQNRLSEYEGFLDKEEEEALERARQMQSLTKTLESTQPIPVTTVPTPPPTQYAQEVLGTSYSSSVLYGWQPGTGAQYPPPQSSGIPNVSHPSPMVYPPPVGYPPYGAPMSYSTNVPPPYYGQPSTVPPPSSSYSLQHETTALAMPATNTQPSQVSNLKEVTPHSIGDATYQPLTGSTVARCLKMIETVTSAAKEKPVKSVQFNLQPIEPSSPPACAESTDGPQTSADADDDIKTKQKRRLEQFNQRMLEKREQQREQREQQYKEMVSRRRMNKDANPNQPGKPIRSEPRNVWICGHSLVYWAEMRAKSPEVGMQLGMDPSSVVVWWKGTQGMTWPQLLPQLLQLKIKWPNPDVVIMHLGGNDLSTDSPTDLLASVKKDLTSMRSIFPQCVLVWSDILPRRVWRHSEDSHEVDLVRTTINRRVHSIISELGGTALTHDNVRCGSNTGLYRADGVHLSSKGIDTFNLNLQDFLEKWEVDANKISD